MVLGHEGIGRIAELPAGKAYAVDGQRLREGDRIIWNRGVTCGRCHACVVQHEPSLCSSRWVYGIHRGAHVPPYLNGSYASHIILQPRTDLFLAPETIAPEVLVAASCSGATAAHAFAMAEIHPGDVVVIYGPGPLGAFCAAFARAQGASGVVMVGSARSAWRMEICQALGATRTLVLAKTDFHERKEAIAGLTGGRGADLVIEAAGSPQATVEALEMARIGGHVSLVGYGEPKGEMAILPFEHIVRKNQHVQGVWVSDARHLKWALELVVSNPAAFAQLVTHRLPLHEADRAMDLVERRQAMKAVLLP
jgi:threonine dehydrogenase-like Zn-dependent dehydrogenase